MKKHQKGLLPSAIGPDVKAEGGPMPSAAMTYPSQIFHFCRKVLFFGRIRKLCRTENNHAWFDCMRKRAAQQKRVIERSSDRIIAWNMAACKEDVYR